MSASAKGAVSKGFQMFIAATAFVFSAALVVQMAAVRKTKRITVRIPKNNHRQEGSASCK